MQLFLPLDLSFNAAIVDIVGRLLPNGYDVSDDAPATYDELTAHLAAGRKLVVWSGGSRGTIYGDPETNYAFRAWHDWCHWIGSHPFTPAGEAAVCLMQCKQITTDFGDDCRTKFWRSVIEAEVIGQNTFAHMHKRFPDDQLGFVLAYLKDPMTALMWSLW